MEALENRFKVPGYLRRFVNNYLHDREFHYLTTEGVGRRNITADVAQGSALGPDMWSVFYDMLLTMDLPNHRTLAGFADDLPAAIVAKNEEQVKTGLF